MPQRRNTSSQATISKNKQSRAKTVQKNNNTKHKTGSASVKSKDGKVKSGVAKGRKGVTDHEKGQKGLSTYVRTTKSTTTNKLTTAVAEETSTEGQKTTIVQQEMITETTIVTTSDHKTTRKRNREEEDDDDYIPSRLSAKQRALFQDEELGKSGLRERLQRKSRNSSSSIAVLNSDHALIDTAQDLAALLPAESKSKLLPVKPVNDNDTKTAFLTLKLRAQKEVSEQAGLTQLNAVGSTEAIKVETPQEVNTSIQVAAESMILEETPKVLRKVIARPKEGWDNEPYRFKFGYTPWPEFQHPLPEAASQVFELLRAENDKHKFDEELEFGSNGPAHGMATGGTVDAIVRTVMSQATNNDSAMTVQKLLLHNFTYTVNGKVVEGRVPNYHKVRTSSEEDLADVLKPAGCHRKRARFIKAALDRVYATNWAALSSKDGIEKGNPADALDFVPGLLSLGFLNAMSKVEIFNWLLGLEGVGVKTACCILGFHYKFQVCAVDIHVWTMAKWLGWLPVGCDTPNAACMHLDARLPDHLKYDVHQAFWKHRQYCLACKGQLKSAIKEEDAARCPIDRMLTRAVVKKRSEPKKVVVKGEGSGDTQAVSPKSLPQVVPFERLTPEKAAELGYDLLIVEIDDDFASGSKTRRVKKKWVLRRK